MTPTAVAVLSTLCPGHSIHISLLLHTPAAAAATRARQPLTHARAAHAAAPPRLPDDPRVAPGCGVAVAARQAAQQAEAHAARVPVVQRRVNGKGAERDEGDEQVESDRNPVERKRGCAKAHHVPGGARGGASEIGEADAAVDLWYNATGEMVCVCRETASYLLWVAIALKTLIQDPLDLFRAL